MNKKHAHNKFVTHEDDQKKCILFDSRSKLNCGDIEFHERVCVKEQK